ncbi:unnamed protein product, partial [Oppiella nova]
MSDNTYDGSGSDGQPLEDFRVSAPKKSRGDDLKRRAHNGIEKRRKDKINYWIYKLADV